MLVHVAQLAIGKALEGHAVAVVILADEHGQAPHLVARRDELALVGHDEQGERALDLLLGILDALDQAVLGVDERANELGHVDAARAHGHELMAHTRERPDELVCVVDGTDGSQREHAQVRANQQGLRIGVADASHGHRTDKARKILLELGAERRVLDGVDLAREALVGIPRHHAGTPRAQMRVIVDTEEHVEGYLTTRRCTKEGSHAIPLHPFAEQPCPLGPPTYFPSIRA